MALGRPGAVRKSHITCTRLGIDQEAEFGPWSTTGPYMENGSLSVAHGRIVSTAHHLCDSLTIACEAMDQVYAVVYPPHPGVAI